MNDEGETVPVLCVVVDDAMLKMPELGMTYQPMITEDSNFLRASNYFN